MMIVLMLIMKVMTRLPKNNKNSDHDDVVLNYDCSDIINESDDNKESSVVIIIDDDDDEEAVASNVTVGDVNSFDYKCC